MTHDHDTCPECASRRMNRLIRMQLGWLAAVGFGLLWWLDSLLSRWLAALALEALS